MLRNAVSIVIATTVLAAVCQADFSIGDRVTLVVRANDIPGHPGDGDQHVSVRFRSGSQAVVQELGNWIRVAGENVNGDPISGWIVRKYIATSDGDNLVEITFPDLEWCPAKGSPLKHPSGRLRIATWNIENLHADDGGRVYRDSTARYPNDYERIRCYVRLFDPDILAVQEVDGEEALARVVDTDVYNVHVSKRPGNQRDSRQNTGFAYKKGLEVVERPDFESLDVGHVRYGARIDVTHNGRTLRLMSVHLKRGCFSNASSGPACDKLEAQVPILESWIDEAALAEDGFIVLGDFNRRLVRDGDLVWAQIDDGDPANADLHSANENMPISCRNNEYTEFIDHIVLDKRATPWLDRSSFRHVEFRQQDKDAWDRISDHCPVVAELWIE